MSAMTDTQPSPQEENIAKARSSDDVSSVVPESTSSNEGKQMAIDQSGADAAAPTPDDNDQSQLSDSGSPAAEEKKAPSTTFPKQIGNAWGVAANKISTDATSKPTTPQSQSVDEESTTDNNTKKRSSVSFASSGDTTVAASKPKFADIMAEQEQFKSADSNSNTKVSFSQEVESEEERMMRLAIEASLKDQEEPSHSGFQSHATKMPPSALRNSFTSGDSTGKSPSFSEEKSNAQHVSFSNNNVAYDANDDGMDDDMRLAIALSLQEAGGGGGVDNYASPGFAKQPPDAVAKDSKMEESEDDSKPSALPKAEVADVIMLEDDMKPAAIERKECGDEQKSSYSDSASYPPAAAASASASASAHAAACSVAAAPAAAAASSVASAAAATSPSNDESEKLAQALYQAELDEFNSSQDANASAEAASLQLAMQLQQEEDARQNRDQGAQAARLKREEMCHHGGGGGTVGVRTVGRDEFNSLKSDKDYGDGRIPDRRRMEEKGMGKLLSSNTNYYGHDDMIGDDSGGTHDDETNDYYYYANDRLKGDDAEYDYDEEGGDDGIRMNSQSSSSKWKRLDKNTFVGPDNEVRTKHDPELKHRSNAAKLLGNHGAKLKDAYSSDNKKSTSVSDRAYNAFRRAESRQSGFKKGVARQGAGRAENMNAGKTRGGAMDGNVRLQIAAAINAGLINNCNGVVKEGKEALVYHADSGWKGQQDSREEATYISSSETTIERVGNDGYDVAVKVFKRIAEFKGRGSYVDGDPRYHKQKFKTNDQRDQVVLWAEKEYRNLLRARRGGVAVPKPLYQKENILFMRFLGENGWPSPQLKEIDIKKGSQKWTTLYCQTIVAIRRLYHCARLVHADLSEYNLLVCPSWQASHDNFIISEERNSDDDTLQVVLIDFGMAVEISHPSAVTWLRRDLSTVRDFFVKQGIKTLPNTVAEEFVTDLFEEANYAEDGMDDIAESVEEDTAETGIDAKNEVADANTKGKAWRHAKQGWDDKKEMEKLLKKLESS